MPALPTDTPAISVDAHFARFGGKSYAIDKINTVEVRQHKPHGKGPVVLFAFLATCSFFPFLGALIQEPAQAPAVGLFFLLFVALTIWANRRSKIIDYQLFLMTSSSEAQAYFSRDREEVTRLRDTIERAMSGKGQA